MLKLLPFSLDEIAISTPNLTVDDLIFRGALPSVHAEGHDPARVYRNYYETYVERDVRMLINVKDLSLFRKFMKLCAGRIGQILNASQLANETGVAVNTIKSWISVLEASFIIYLLPPWYDNINKRLVKSPKLFFYDTGIASYLLGIRNIEQVQRDPLRGVLFENLVMNEIIKKYYNSGLDADIYFYRDKYGNEVDALLKSANVIIPVEIKSAETFHIGFIKNLRHLQALYPDRILKSLLVYAGKDEYILNQVSVINYRKIYQEIKLNT